MKKIIFGVILILTCLMVFSVITNAASSGKSGSNLTWKLDNEGTLTITGSGSMPSYWSNDPAYPRSSNSNYSPNLISVEIGNNVTSIGHSAFSSCENLKSITIGENVTSIDDAFSGCTALEKIYWNAKNVGDFSYDSGVFSEAGQSGDGIDVIFGESVERIPAYTFYVYSYAPSHLPKIISVTISDSVTSIGNSAFSDCSWLTHVTIGKCVTSIESSAFYGCKSLTNVTLGDNIKNIGDAAFYDCSNLKTIELPNTLETIGSATFRSSGITQITIPNAVNIIGERVFLGCLNLESVIFECQITIIPTNAFKGCLKLESVVLSNSVSEIQDLAFSTCQSLKELVVPESVVLISETAFEGSDITLNVKIGSYALEYAIENGIKYKIYGFEDKNIINRGVDSNGIRWYLFEDGLLIISGEGAMVDYSLTTQIPWYDERTNISEIIIGKGITHIGDRSFYNCINVQKITIPDSVTSIGTYVFKNCDEITIRGEAGTYAMIYASSNDIPFIDVNKELKPIFVEMTENSLKWYFDVSVEDFDDAAIVYIAVYNSLDILLSVTSDILSVDDLTSLSLPKEENAKYIKVFVWKDNLSPVTPSKTIDL